LTAALAAGADSYLTKPFSPRDLLSRLDEALLL
jgi:DNA-binding response OmpR family regulator